MFQNANHNDIHAISDIYDRIHQLEQTGHYTTGWLKGVYPTQQTAQDAIDSGTMYVYEHSGQILAAGRIDHVQPPSYKLVDWSLDASGPEVMVLHTLVVHPDHSGQGIGRTFIACYEAFAKEHGCSCLRIDTSARNIRARELYRRLGYTERGIVPCQFNGIDGVQLVCLEKLL